MDLARFGLLRRPFRPAPDPHNYVPVPATEAALVSLHRAFTGRENVALVDGGAGLGKTLVALKFLDELDADLSRLFIPAARFVRPVELFQTLLFDADAAYHGHTEHELRLAVTDRLLRGLAAGPTVLVLDEAQHLSAEVLEELRLLGNLSSRSATALFVVLVAQPTLRARLLADATGFAQRIGVRVRVAALSAEESDGYLVGQLRQAGARDVDVLTPDARRVLAASCGGVPRVLNQAALAAFALAGSAGETRADVEAASDALNELGLEVQDPADAVPMAEPEEPPVPILPDPPEPRRAKPGGRRKSA